jgi:hypothetical protein
MSDPAKRVVTEYSGEFIKIDGYCYKFTGYTDEVVDIKPAKDSFVGLKECNNSKVNILSLSGDMNKNDYKVGNFPFPVKLNGLNFEAEELTIGTLSLHGNQNSTLMLVGGDGDTDNHLFKVVGDNILQMKPFKLGGFFIRLQSMNDEGIIQEKSVLILLEKGF